MESSTIPNIAEEFRTHRGLGNERIMEEDFLPIKRFFALDSRAYESGAISSKYKELMGLVASAVLRCNDCISYHLDRCISEGCSKEELNEALNIALIVGGSIVIPHLRHAYSMIDGLFELQKKGGAVLDIC
ncbi:MAG: carboxymuconolactone decarboxylase family protein [Ignavibacteria bacterium]|nr:carboxymuconolactone decarboxylase family protein [Ignavibacteria bacterium]